MPKQSYKKVIKDASLRESTANNTPTARKDLSDSTKENSKKSKPKAKEKPSEKSSKSSISGHKKKKSKSNDSENVQNEIDLLGSPIKTKTTKDREKKDKESHHKKSSKTKKTTSGVKDSKSGYEEALGISTPSKEIY